MANEKSPGKKVVGKGSSRSAKKATKKGVGAKVAVVPEPQKVEPPESVKPVVPEPATLGSPASLGKKDPANDDLLAIVEDAIAAKCNATIYVKCVSDLNAVYGALSECNTEASIGVGVRDNLHARATWRRKVD